MTRNRRLGAPPVLLLLAALFPVPICAPAEQSSQGLVRRFEIPASPIEFHESARPGRFFDTMSRRAGLLGSEGAGFEAWVYPLKLLHDCRLHAQVKGSNETVDLGARLETVTVRPESVTLTSTHSLFTLRQTLFTPLDLPGAVLLLDVETSRPLTVTVSFVPDLRPMWPAGLGGQYASWNDARKLFVISESRRKYNGLIGSPAAVRGTTTPAHELSHGSVSFNLQIQPSEARTYYYPIVIAGSQTGRDEAYKAYDELLGTIPARYQTTVGHYRDIQRKYLSIESPEPMLNRAFEWAKVSLEKGIVDNPDLGTGLVAGWGLSGESARPGFGWFFGGDTFINQYAIAGYGAFDTIRQAFRFLQARQRADGKMMHELSQAAGWVPWFEDYPYGYYHGDTTPFYIVSFADLLAQTGDRPFLEQSWDSLKRAYAWCKAADEDADGLVDNTKAGLGASELGSLLEGLHTDILLAALSPAAWRAMAWMAELMSDADTRGEAQMLYEKASRSANEKFWNSETRSLVHALTVSGKQNRELTVWPSVGIMLGVFGGDHADATVELMASNALSTDWGTRILSTSSADYDPSGYNNGAVWPFLTGLAGAAAYERHHSAAGYAMLLANARLTTVSALGAHPELLSGDFYRTVETAVPHQLFSSAGLLTPFVRGMLGLKGNALSRTVDMRPHLPPSWGTLSVHRYRVGENLLHISYERAPDRRTYIVSSSQPGYRLALSAPVGMMGAVTAVALNGAAVPFETVTTPQDSHCNVAVPLGQRDEIVVRTSGGVELDPLPEPLEVGDSSHALRIVSTRWNGNRINAVLEGKAGRSYGIRVWGRRAIAKVMEGVLEPGDPCVVRVNFSGDAAVGYVRKTMILEMGELAPPKR
jgi:glycogen debranching enzyme